MTDLIALTDKDLTARITGDLLSLPELLFESETLLQNLRADIRVAEKALAEAELDAQINAPATGKNAEERKLQMAQAVSAHPRARELRQTLTDLQMTLAQAEIANKKIVRQWQAATALCEMQAAKISFLSRARVASNGKAHAVN